MKSGMTNYSGIGRPYGGIGWLVKRELNHNIKIEFISKRISTLEIGNLTIIGVYLTSNDGSSNSIIEHNLDLEELSTIIEKLESEEKLFLIVGDFNSDPIRKKNFDKCLFKMTLKRNIHFLKL